MQYENTCQQYFINAVYTCQQYFIDAVYTCQQYFIKNIQYIHVSSTLLRIHSLNVIFAHNKTNFNILLLQVFCLVFVEVI
jgi:hypothetical protein